MTVRASIRASYTPVAGPHTSGTTDLSVVITDDPDRAVGNVVWGTSVTPPATYGDLSNANAFGLTSADKFAFTNSGGGLVRETATYLGLSFADQTIGQDLWVAFVAVATPLSGSPLINPMNLGTVVA